MSPHDALARHRVLICGAPGVGTSTVAFGVFLAVLGDGRTASYLDAGQLGFGARTEPGPQVALRARNLAAAWSVHHGAGAEVLIACASVVDPAEARAYATAVPGPRATVCLLDAGVATLEERLLGRRLGESPQLPGPSRVGSSEGVLRALARTSADSAERLRRSGVADLVVPTDGRTPGEVVADLRRALAP